MANSKQFILDLFPDNNNNEISAADIRTFVSTVFDEELDIVDIQDNLISVDTDKPLSANQGRVLDSKIQVSADLIDTKENSLGIGSENQVLSMSSGIKVWRTLPVVTQTVIRDDLVSITIDEALTANQGRVLNNKISVVTSDILINRGLIDANALNISTNATNIGLLDTRLTSAENLTTINSSGISNNLNLININSAGITSNAIDIDNLDLRLTTAELDIESNTVSIISNATNIDNIELSLISLDSRISTNTNNINTLDASLSVDIYNLTSRISTAENDILSLDMSILSHATNISTNAANIVTNTTDIDNLEFRTTQVELDIDTNTTNIASNTATNDTNATNISLLNVRTTQAELDIDTNTTNILTNSTNISINSIDINNLEIRTAEAELDIDTLELRVTQTEANISTNASDISVNSTDIDTLELRVTQNKLDIDTNALNISIDALNISASASNISALDVRLSSAELSITDRDIDIASNSADISTNTANILTNSNNISLLDSRIIQNDSDISTLSLYRIEDRDIIDNNVILIENNRLNIVGLDVDISELQDKYIDIDFNITQINLSLEQKEDFLGYPPVTGYVLGSDLLGNRAWYPNAYNESFSVIDNLNAEGNISNALSANQGWVLDQKILLKENKILNPLVLLPALQSAGTLVLTANITDSTDDLTGRVTGYTYDWQETGIGILNNLTTTNKSDLVSAINEVNVIVTASGHGHLNKDILDATTASYTIEDESKIDFISITQPVNLDNIESQVSTNTTNIGSLDLRVTSTETQGSTNTTNIGTNTTNIDSLDSRVTSTETQVGLIDIRLTQSEVDITNKEPLLPDDTDKVGYTLITNGFGYRSWVSSSELSYSTFTSLLDTPDDYIGSNGKVISVNGAENGLVYLTINRDYLNLTSAESTGFELSTNPYMWGVNSSTLSMLDGKIDNLNPLITPPILQSAGTLVLTANITDSTDDLTGRVTGYTYDWQETGIGILNNLTTTNKSDLVSAINEVNSTKSDLDSPSLTGVPLAPTADVGTDTNQIATTAFVNAEIADNTYSKTQLDTGQLDTRYYTETEINSLLAGQNEASEIVLTPVGNLSSINVQAGLEELQLSIDEINTTNTTRPDKYLAGQDVYNMLYDIDGNLEKVRYNADLDVNYEILTYINNKLSNISHYLNSVLAGNTILSYNIDGRLISSIYTGV